MVLAYPQARQREVCLSGYHLPTLPSSSQANALAPVTPHHSLALDLVQPGPEKRLYLGTQRKSRGPGHSAGGAVAATVGTYPSCTPETVQTSESSTAPKFP